MYQEPYNRYVEELEVYAAYLEDQVVFAFQAAMHRQAYKAASELWKSNPGLHKRFTGE